MADEPEIEDGESEGGGKNKVLFVIFGFLILLVIAAGAWWFMSGDEEEVSGADLELEAETLAQTGPTEVYELGEFQVNLSGSGGARILIMEIAVEGIPDAVTNIESRQHQVRDAVAPVHRGEVEAGHLKLQRRRRHHVDLPLLQAANYPWRGPAR